MKVSTFALSKLVNSNNGWDGDEFAFTPSADDFERRMEELGVPEYPEDFTFEDWVDQVYSESGKFVDEKSANRTKFTKNKLSKNLSKLKQQKGKVSTSKETYEAKKSQIKQKLARLAKLQAESGDYDAGFDEMEFDLFSGYKDFLSEVPQKMKKYLSVIEDILCMLVTISGVNNPYSATSGIWLLVKKLVGNDEALAVTVFRAIFNDCTFESIVAFFSHASDKVDRAFTAATGVMAESSDGPKSDSERAVASWTCRIFDSFEVLKNSELIHKIVKLISILLATGFVGNSRKLELTVAGLNLFSIQAAKEAATGSTLFDLVETSLAVGHLFMTKLWVCFERRSIKPLFLSEWGGDEYQRQYSDIMAFGPDMIIGVKCKQWPTFGCFVDNIRYLVGKTEQMISMAKAVEKRVLTDRLVQLKKLLAKAEEKEADGGLRASPFTFIVSGASSTGKSTIVNILIDFSLKRIAWEEGNKDFVTDPRSIAVVNELDEYDSDIHAFTLATLDDDKANAAFDKCNTNPTLTDIRFINNIKRKAIKAALEEKSRINICPLVSASTTNVPNKWAWHSNAPESALRRYILHIRARIKKDWQAPRPTNLIDVNGAEVPESVEMAKLNHSRMADEADEGNFYPDAWEFKVTEWIPVTAGGKERAITEQCEPIEVLQSYYSEIHQKEVKCLNIGLPELLELIADRIKTHTRTQESVVRSSEEIFVQKLCSHGNVSNFCPHCLAEKETDAVVESKGKGGEGKNSSKMPSSKGKGGKGKSSKMPSSKGKGGKRKGSSKSRVHAESSWTDAEQRLSKAEREFGQAYNCVAHLRRNPLAFCFSLTPEWVANNHWVVLFATYLIKRDRLRWFTISNGIFFVLNWVFFILFNIGVRTAGIYSAVHLSIVGITLNTMYRSTFNQIKNDRLIIQKFVKTAHDVQAGWRRYLIFGFSASISLLAVIRLWRVFKTNNKKELRAEGQALYTNNNSTENPWLSVAKKPLPQSVPVNSQFKDLAKKVESLQVLVRYHHAGGKKEKWSNGFIPFSGFIILPYHEVCDIPEEGLRISLQDSPSNVLSGLNFTTNITSDSVRLIGEEGKSDAALVSIPRIGKRENLSDMFLAENEWTNTEVQTQMFFRSQESQIVKYPSRFYKFEPCATLSGTAFDKAAWYKWKEASFPGLCMSTHVFVHGSRAYIAGFHLAGSQRENGDNVAQMINRHELDAARRSFPNSVNPLIAEIGTIPTSMYGIDFTPVHKEGEDTNLGYQEQAQADYYGTLPNARVRPKSSVVKSPIADVVEEVTGCPQKWGPPPNCRRDADGRKVLKEYEPYQKYLSGAGNAYQEFRPATLEKARADYMCMIHELISGDSEVKEYASTIRKLDLVEIVSGQDGVKFVDAMKPNTSMGWPLNKPKEEFLRDLLPEDHPLHNCPRAIADMVVQQAEHDREEYRAGRSANPIFKNCTKDEPTKLEKMKARVFQAAPAHFQLLVREYFLPIAAFISRYPLDFECAVGINSQGPQWDALMKHVSSVGNGERLVAGDFKAYDQHMSGRMILIALNIMIDIAEKYMNYSDDDVEIMRYMASDIAFPLVSINGDLTQLFGSNPSGQNLTVYVNSIVNSLYQRCVFFEIYPDFKEKFSDFVKLTTYGDDNLMGVHESLTEYNHTRMAEIYAAHDIVFTMAQKEAESVPFIGMNDVEYLKRWSRFDPSLSYKRVDGTVEHGMYIAMLDEDSIFKSLMQNLKSKTEPQSEVAVQCIEGAMREWFFHGEEKFNERHSQMKEVVERMNYTNWMSSSFWDSYEKREADWMYKYGISREG